MVSLFTLLSQKKIELLLDIWRSNGGGVNLALCDIGSQGKKVFSPIATYENKTFWFSEGVTK